MKSDSARRSLSVFPAGSNGEFNLPRELTTVIERGEGCRLWTLDGKQMLDMSMGWGSVLVGHADPQIGAAIRERLALGSNFAYVSEPSLQLAEEIVRLSPACESIRYAASGTEATMYCLRLARAFTGRHRVLKFEGAYHGAHDVGVTSLFPREPSDFPHPQPSSAGIVAHRDDGILVVPFNDLEMVEHTVARFAKELAGVIVEPLQRCLVPAPGFLQGLRDICNRHNVLLIFDEVVTGFRLAYGGAQEYYGVIPDLVAYGKALGGGLPIGVYGGRNEVMELVCEDRIGQDSYVWTASTLGGNPLSTTSALATLAILREPKTYDRLRSLGRYLRHGLRCVLDQCHISGTILGDGPLAQIAFTNQTPLDYRSSQHTDPQFARGVMLGLFRSGVFLNPMGTKLYLSLAHSETDCDEFCELLRSILSR